MAFFSLIAVLLLEQIHPLDQRRWVQAPLHRLADFVEHHVNAGERRQALVAWCVVTLGTTALALAVYLTLRAFSPLLAGAWNFLVLYLALGFRELARDFHDIQTALRVDDLSRARGCAARWRSDAAAATSAADIAAIVVEESLLRGHQRVFGVLACYVLLPGPAGAVLYRVAEALMSAWGRSETPESPHFAAFSRQAYAVIDWFPKRLTAAAFATTGDFENAIYCWRTQVSESRDGEAGGVDHPAAIVLASGAGALGVRLFNGRFGVGPLADCDALRRVSGLLARVVVLWLLVLMLLSVAQ